MTKEDSVSWHFYPLAFGVIALFFTILFAGLWFMNWLSPEVQYCVEHSGTYDGWGKDYNGPYCTLKNPIEGTITKQYIMCEGYSECYLDGEKVYTKG